MPVAPARIYIIAFLLLITWRVQAQEHTSRRVVLLGGHCSDAVLQGIRTSVPFDSNTTILYLGDFTGNTKAERWQSIDAMAAIVKGSGANLFFIPGNKEWNNEDRSGEKRMKELATHIKAFDDEHIRLYPKGGCPGPHAESIGKHAKLIMMDTQWWLRESDKPGIESDCSCKNEQQVLDKVEDIVADNRDKLIIFAAHHSFRSTGIHSGYFGPRQHFFPLTDLRGLRNAWLPLPGIGSIYPVVRSVAITRQDALHSAYARMAASLDAILAEHPFAIRAGGSEQALELYEAGGAYYISSGAGSKADRVVRTQHTPFAGRHTGFAVIDISDEKKAGVAFYEIIHGKAVKSFEKNLLDFSARPPIKAAEPAVATPRGGDSVSAAVYAKYGDASWKKRLFFGNNYRAEWASPIVLPRFHIAEDARNFTIEGQGGGKQTTTIRLKDKDGKIWSLRSIVKDPHKVLPPAMRETIAEDVMKDLMSASYPFAPVIANGLSDAAGVVRPQVEYYYVPDDTALGYYRPAFANTVVALEERQPSRHGEETKGTWTVFNEHIEHWKDKLDARSYLRARLLDVLLGDFDRHYEQWKWGSEWDADSTRTFYAIPKDRDQALFNSDGLLIKIGANQGMSYLKGLKADIANIKNLGFVSRDMDALFLNELTAADWQSIADSLHDALTDAVIDSSAHALPQPAYTAHGERIAARLKSRRDALPKRAMEYYRFLTSNVSIVGSNERDHFEVRRAAGGLQVTVSGKTKSGDEGIKYQRVFKPSETDEIRLYGLGADDRFNIAPDVPRGIRIRIIGGRGEDTFDVQGRARTLVYDAAGKGNVFLHSRHTTSMVSSRRDVNDYAFRENSYGSFSFPTVALGYNVDDGFLAGIGMSVTKRGFRADPFTAQQRLNALFAIGNRAYQLRYSGTFNDVYRHYDLLLNAALLNPALQNFFGLGNETVRDTALPLRYYRVRYSYVSGDALIRKRAVHNKFSIALGPSFFYYWNNNDRNTGRILDYAESYGLDSARIFSPKFYGGGKLTIDFNSIDNILLPTHGLRFHADAIAQTGLNEGTLPFFRAQSDMALFAPLSDNKRFILTLRGGGGHIFSDGFEYWQALTLGANNFLRGYRKNRFSGTSMAYGSGELRWRLAHLKGRILPGEFGLIGFADAGRVWLRGEQSDKWHTAAGGGLYFTPYNAVLISVLGAVSDEERLINASIGFGLNIVF